jgi:Uma2 family endonuclease
MSEPYEEIIEGESFVRQPPGVRHELIRERLAARLTAAIELLPSTRLLATRSVLHLTPGTMVRPDLTVVASANDRLLLAVEVIDPGDHRLDTVVKKEAYESRNVPRLWMVDPRYDNVEVYHGSPYGLRLQGILAGSDRLEEALLPEFAYVIRELFADR